MAATQLAPLLLPLLLAGVSGLPDTEVTALDQCRGGGCLQSLALAFPKATPGARLGGTGPQFAFNLTGKLPSGEAAAAPIFEGKLSLGLPKHPLGIFGAEGKGSACGTQRLLLESGILGVVTLDFPACPWPAEVLVPGRVDIWTPLPAVPVLPHIGLPVSFHSQVRVHDSAGDLLAVRIELAQHPGTGADKSQDTCAMDFEHMPQYPPAQEPIAWETLDLDVDPQERWTHIVKPRTAEIKALINAFIANLPRGLNSTLVRVILDMGADKLLSKVPAPFDDEIRGIAKATGIDVGYIFVYNIMYEVEGLCTSMVSQDAEGNIYHSRNLDFGLFDGVDEKAQNWLLTEKLRSLLFNLRVVRGGVTLYNATQYGGFVGLLTGAKRDGFSLSVNSRFDAHLDMYLVLWLTGRFKGDFLTWKTRQVMESAGDYEAAVQQLSNYSPLGPAYIIVGGAKQNEGAVIQLAAGKPKAMLVRTLKEAAKADEHFVVQTNYDWPAPPPSFDDRRYPLEDCMRKLGRPKTGWASLWGAHSTSPTLNALTTYTTLMSGQTGHFEAYKQLCNPGPNCAPFRGQHFGGSSLEVPDKLLLV